MEVFFQSTEVVRCNGLEFVRCHRKDLDQDLNGDGKITYIMWSRPKVRSKSSPEQNIP